MAPHIPGSMARVPVTQFRSQDDLGRIWSVQDLLTLEHTAEIAATDWSSLAWIPAARQETWPRRQIHWDEEPVQRYSRYISSCLPRINSALGTEFQHSYGHFWLDLPGFQVPLHTDGHVPNAMQLYWVVPGPEYGTGFYRYNTKDSLIYQTISRPNSGYIMLNHLAPDGHQPLLWHGMFEPVPAGTIRVSSYWRFS